MVTGKMRETRADMVRGSNPGTTDRGVRRGRLVGAVALILTGATTANPVMAQVEPPAVTAALPADVTCSTEMVAMRDGVKLGTTIYRPRKPGKYPVIMERTAYNGTGKSHPLLLPIPAPCENAEHAEFATKGYVFITQDARGTYRSEGVFRARVQEGDDGYDAIEWAARQPWSNGKIGMQGRSYDGMVQWQAAFKRPPHLVTIVPSIAPLRFDSGWPISPGGVPHQSLIEWWTVLMTSDLLYHKLVAAGLPEAEIRARVEAYEKPAMLEVLAAPAQRLPAATNPAFNNEFSASFYGDWILHPTLDDYWRPSTPEKMFESVSIPVLNLGSAWDVFAGGTVDGFTGMQQKGGSAKARSAARMVFAGGGHVTLPNNYMGAINFGPENMIPADLTLRWFDYWLKGIDNGIMNEPAVKLYVMLPPDEGALGSGFWVSSSTFPLPGTQTVRYYLGGGPANTVVGSGALTTGAPSGPPDQFLFDQKNPVPTIGGNHCCWDALTPAAQDQRPVESRPDVLVYTSEAMTKATPVIGDITVTLNASSSATDTAFTAKLVDVYPTGFAQIITDGIVAAKAGSPGAIATYTIRMNPTATVFKPGHKIRLEISSSSHPRWPVSTNPLAKPEDLKVATQRVLREGTSLNLPVAPASILPAELR